MARDDDKYCDECGEHLDDCECEEEEITLDDVNKVIDTASKGLDFLDKLKKFSTTPEPKPISDNYAKWMSQDMVRKQRIHDEQNKKQLSEDKKKHRKWVIETIIKIAVPIVVALIGVGFYISNT